MSHESLYRATTALTVEELVPLDLRLRAGFKSFRGFLPGSEQTVYCKNLGILPDWREKAGVELGHATVRGRLPLGRPPFDAFQEVFKRGKGALGKYNLGISVGFEEAQSQQTNRAFDTLSIRYRAGKLFFEYAANGSKVMHDSAYSRSFLERLIRIADLPMSISESGGHYFMAHTEGRELDILRSRGVKDESPTGFRCELVEVSPESCVIRLEACLAELATNKRFEYWWSAGPSKPPLGRNPEDREIYELIRGLNLPAERYELTADLYFDALEGIEEVRRDFSPRDKLTTPLGVVKIEENTLNLEIFTDQAGHWLDVEAEYPLDTSELELLLGLPFEEL